MTQIKVENATMGYEGVPVIKDLSFQINEGDYVCIVGENGSGKTTLMKGILGLNPPLKGSITYNGLDKNEIGYLPQKKNIQKDFPASVMEVVLSGCINRKYHIFHNKKDKIKTILKLEMSENKVADTLADETNTKVRTFYSAESVSKEDFANNITYVDLMERNNNALKEALSNDTN